MNRQATRTLRTCTCGSSLSLMVHGLVVEHDCPQVYCNWQCVYAAGVALNVWEKQYCKTHFVWHLGHNCPLCERHYNAGGHHG